MRSTNCWARERVCSEISAALNVSAHTVESYYSRIQVKLDLNGMYELRRHAIEYVRKRAG